ncbi:hypothetical protein D3C87_1563120 [compost metagenome]
MHILNIAHQIAGVSIIPLRFQTSAPGVAVVFHPHRRGPGRAQDFQFGIDGKNLFQDRDHIVAVGAKVEMMHFRVGLALRNIVIGKYFFIKIGGAYAYAQVSHADSIAGR